MIKRILTASLLMLTLSSHTMHQLPAPDLENIEQDPLFNTKFITNNRKAVMDHLQTHYQASSLDIITQDNVTLKAISIPAKTQDPERIIVAFAGFYPGLKEGMTPLVPLFSGKHKIILVDQRGHGESDGNFWINLRRYGIDEVKDVEAVMNYVKLTYPTSPITMLGLCSGGYNATRTLEQLKKADKLKDYNVDSLILDSAFVSGTSVLHAAEHHFQKVVPPLFKPLYPNDSNEELRNRLLPKLIWFFIGYPCITLLKFLVQGGIEKHNPETRIDTNIGAIKETPILAIHAEDDGYAGKEHVEQLVKDHGNKNDEIHIFKNSSHGNNFLKYKTPYQEIVVNFINKIKATKE